MAGDFVVWILVGLVVLLGGRWFYRALAGTNNSCGCSSGGCGQADPYKETDGVEVACGKIVTCVGTESLQGKRE